MPRPQESDDLNLDLDLSDIDLADEPGDARVRQVEQAAKEIPTAFQQRAKREDDRFTLATDSEYWVCFCFETREQKEEFLAQLGVTQAKLGDKHVDGLKAARLMGLKLATPRADWPATNKSRKLDRLVFDE